MKEQFERTLRNHIRDTFDHYDDQMADDGWRKFKQQKNRKKRGLIFWYGLPSGIAAALALLWIFNLSTKDIVKTNNNPIVQNQNKFSPAQPSLTENIIKNTEPVASVLENRKSDLEETVESKKLSQVYTGISSEKLLPASTIEERQPLNTIITDDLYVGNLSNNHQNDGVTVIEPSLKINTKPKPVDAKDLTFNRNLINNLSNSHAPSRMEEKETKKSKNDKFNFAVDANTFYSFTSAGVNNDLNLGIGILSELKLTKRLSINSGISLNKQSAIYQNTNPVSQSYAGLAAPTGKVSSLSKQGISIPDEVKTGAKLVGFDIPINLKYNLPIGKIKSFISGGLSSYSLLSQSYVNDVSVVNYSLRGEPTTSVLRNVDEESEGVFSNFQFARTLNFSFGILYPLSIKNSISIEPFVKYPIAGFGNQDLEIGSGGISFKLNFGK